MKNLFSFIGAVALMLLGVVFTVSFQEASANGASYLAAIGITGVPEFFKTALAGTIFTVVLTAILTAVVTTRVISMLANSNPSDLSFANRADDLVEEMNDYLKYKGYGLSGQNPDRILQNCNSFNLTLRKAGLDIPCVPPGSASSMFGVLSNYYQQVGPLLRDDHPLEARKVARSFAQSYPPPTNSQPS